MTTTATRTNTRHQIVTGSVMTAVMIRLQLEELETCVSWPFISSDHPGLNTMERPLS